MKHLSRSVAQTEQIAAELARSFVGGECIALYGDLGAGKTQFVRGIVRGVGGEARVSSPTFVLLNVYETPRFKVYHLDAYRVHGPEDFAAIGFAELLDQGGIITVEWPGRVEALLPADRMNVNIRAIGKNCREIDIEVRKVQ